MDTYGHICIHMDTYGYIWGPKSQARAQNWRRALGQGPLALALGQGPMDPGPGPGSHGTPPPVLGQGLALGPPYVSILCIHMCPYIPICILMYPYVSICVLKSTNQQIN